MELLLPLLKVFEITLHSKVMKSICQPLFDFD